MRNAPPKVITIPADPAKAEGKAAQHLLRVAAYCRVSTKDEEQISSYEAQQTYYTDKIMTNREWTMAGIFADEGITGTSAKKRPEFLKMIRMCRQGKIDLILTKSISRFARNTVDSLRYVRLLRELGIGIYFEEQNINTLEMDSEMFLAILSIFAQSESESTSSRVRWGKRQAMREGKATIQYKWLYAYEKGEDGEPRVIPEQAEVVREIYKRFLAGASLRQIQTWLDGERIPNNAGQEGWAISAIRSILTNEKYCGDVLSQKTFIQDCISHKVIRNNGQLPKYLLQDHHQAIVEREDYNRAQSELARRTAARSPSRKAAPTGLSSYPSRFALSDRLVCGECGTLYRRCTWTQKGQKRIVWRCVSRLDYGKKYCHHSPTLDEEPLQRAILAALNAAMSQKAVLLGDLTAEMAWEVAPIPGETISLGDIRRRLEELDEETKRLVAKAAEEGDMEKYAPKIKAAFEETAALKEKRAYMEERQKSDALALGRLRDAEKVLEQAPAQFEGWNDSVIRQLVARVTVLSAERLQVTLQNGFQIEQNIVE